MPEIKNIVGNSSIGRNPAAYRINEILLENHSGREVDISNLVTNVKISESIYQPF